MYVAEKLENSHLRYIEEIINTINIFITATFIGDLK